MTLPTTQQDVWAKATQQDIVTALSRIGLLPSRPVEPGTEDVARDAMYRALRGVTKFGLNEAIDAILQGNLGHGFFPSPPELRQQCDRAMQPYVSAGRRARTLDKQLNDRRSFEASQAAKTPEARERVARIYADYCESRKTGEIEAERAHIREKNGMTPEKLAEIEDASAGSWERLRPEFKKPAE